MFTIKLIATIILSILVVSVFSYPDGAPTDACDTLEPNHETHLRQSSVAPFRVVTDRLSYSNGDQPPTVTVTIEALTDETAFKGFAMVARKVGSSTKVGEFFPLDGLAQLVNCGTGADTITHSNNDDKAVVSFQWIPSENFSGQVVFTATIVKNYENYWTGVKSQAISIA